MTSRTDWWQSFFTGLVVDFWRAAMTPEATRAEADFFEKHLRVQPGARLLDVPCGDGRLSLELARRGYRMTGVDLSEEFLATARESAQREALSITWRHSDMRDLPWTGEFDGAFCGGSSFGFLGDEGDTAFVAAVCRAIAHGARFAIDAIKAAEVILPAFRERNEMQLKDIHFVGENRYDPETGWIDNRYTVTRHDRSETRVAAHRVYTYRDIARMLEEAGFGECEGLGSLDGEPFRLGSSRLILIASKRR
jgi:SAM-dependent methyltransferase